MSENAPNNGNGGGANDPLKLRNTDTATLKRIPVANPALASSAAKKTIKLKPLAPKSAGDVSEDPSLTETVPLGQAAPSPVKPASPSSPVPAPTILLTRAPKPAPASTPQFMSTATAPVTHVSTPPKVVPVPVSNLGTNEDETKKDEPKKEEDNFIATSTTSQPVERMKIKPSVFIKPVSPLHPIAPSVPPSVAIAPAAPAVPATPKYVSTATGAMAPIKPGEASVPAGGAQPPKYVSTATGAMAPIKPGEASVPAGGAQPPKYVSTATGAMPPIKPGEAPVPAGAQPPKYVSTATAPVQPLAKPKVEAPVASSAVGTTTQGMQKQSQAIAAAKLQSGLQSAKPAIKLRPSASAVPDEKLTPSSPTVRLQPKADSAVSPVPPTDSRPIEVEQKPAPAPAQASGNTVTTKIPRNKVILQKPSMPSSINAPAADQQPSLRQQGDIAATKITSGVAEAEQAIQLTLNKPEESKPAPVAAPEPEVPVAEVPLEEVAPALPKSGKDEPNLLFAISAILAFLVLGYTVFALTAQYLTTWEKQQIPVVGFQHLDKALHKK